MDDLTREQIMKMNIPELYHTLAEYRAAFQEQELKVDRQRALLTGESAATLADSTADTMAVIRTNYTIAQDETFAEMQREQVRLGSMCLRLSAEIKARGLQL